ncbi:putative nicotinate-nucleotide adenylyltransferase [Legionella antarctica]|uniref:Probable nicotinate-nucleotide adenylyltransferase n=1 Tax=Legionella antarctica TaxID=2708020 RepID=A0A6F8T5H7_9GAMM|nr:nicotinate-nucleotide adenylyltransferase [Legionella antarctica]BCA95282.1 putative nicotinate-nucleotide adenylyltransferase [Legionella antarctica]
MHSIAILGGTFDPVHNGHIQTSLSIQSNFKFDDFYFLPCKAPTLKLPTCARPVQRIEMLQIAIKHYPDFKLDLREIRRDSPSYMVETLASFREEMKNTAITLIMGYDAFLSLPQWHQWHRIIELANLLVINRSLFSKHPIPEAIKKLLIQHETKRKTQLLTQPAGAVFLFNAGNYEISSTHIRDDLKKNKSVETRLPGEVYEYIKTQELYQ